MAARRRRPPPSAPRRIAIGSQHPAKVAAATAVLRQAFPHAEIIALTVDSGVRPAPTSAGETIQGALGRARRALGGIGAVLGIGMEEAEIGGPIGWLPRRQAPRALPFCIHHDTPKKSIGPTWRGCL